MFQLSFLAVFKFKFKYKNFALKIKIYKGVRTIVQITLQNNLKHK